MASTFLDSLNLNEVQRSAVAYDEGAELVFAGAGTGKTRVLTAKIAWLIQERGVRPGNIFAATFTNKAAGEMKERISELINLPCDGLWIGTFHSLCVRILRRDAEKLGFSRYFSIYDSSDQLGLLKNCMKEALIDEKALQPKAVLHVLSSYKNQGLSPEDVKEVADSFYEKEIAKLFFLYQQGLKDADAMDFDDLIGHVVTLLQEFPEIVKQYQDLFRYILVDEYQDTNGIQFSLVQAFAGAVNPVFAVGDDDQSIYGWRGAQVENILNFEKSFPGTKTFKLEQNYRSTQKILSFSNSVIELNENRADKKLWSDIAEGAPVSVQAYADDRKEASSIVSAIVDKCRGGAHYSDIAILFRTNAQSRLFEEHLRKNNVPYVLVGGTSFYERKEIKDVLAYLKLLVNPKDSVSCQRVLNVPARGIGAKSQENISLAARRYGYTFSEMVLSGEAEGEVRGKALKGIEKFRVMMQSLLDMSNNNTRPAAILTELLSESGYIDQLTEMGSEESRGRIENINELLNAITEWQENHEGGKIAEFLEEITLASSVDTWDGTASVSLMTLHTAKGLEFTTVYLVGVEEGLLPSRQNVDDPKKLEEERRLMYVGATRAKKELICSYAESRMRFGSIMPMGMSQFIQAVPEELYELRDETTLFSTISFEDEFEKPRYDQRRVQRRESGGASGYRSDGRTARTSRPSQRPQVRKAPVVDDFSQEVVQFRMGQIVRHAKFGEGKIMNMSGFGPDMRLTVLFNDGQRKQMVAKFAKFETV